MKKFFTLALILCITLTSAFAGGSGQTRPGQTVGGPQPLQFLTNVNVDTEGYDVNDHPYVKFLEQKFNVRLEIITETAQYQQKLNTTMASGNLPDYINILSKNDLQRWASEGLLLPLDSYVEKSPNLKDQIFQLGWDLSSYDGKKYAVPLLRYDSTPFMGFARKDWLANVGIDPANIRTVDDWANMFRALTFNDPARTGRRDTFGISGAGTGISNGLYTLLLDAFGGATAQVVNGEVIPYFLTEGYKNFLKFMAGLYAEGVIDPAYVMSSGQQFWDDINNNKIGSFMWFWMTTELRQTGFDVEKLVSIEPPMRVDGSGRSFYKYGSPIRTFTALTSQCRNPEKVMEMLDWSTSEEGGIYVMAGLEGIDWNWVGNNIVIKEDRRGKNTSLRFILLGTQRVRIDTPILQDLMRQAWGETGLSFLNKSNTCGGYDEVDMLAPFFPELSMYDLESPVVEFRDLAIMGRVNIDTEWDNYVRRWRNAGGNDQIRLTTQWYNRSYKK